MYHSCIFCSADLGTNESIEEFPVGRSLAFDAWKGRLWAICPRCRRWNLAPIEERWEAVERAEARFRDSPLRVQSENIGLSQLADGTRLIRVGEALAGELAAWRYGDELLRRRWRYWLKTGVGAVVSLVSGLPAWPGYILRKEVVHCVSPEASPTGRKILVRRKHLDHAEFHSHHSGVGMVARLRPRGRIFKRLPALELQGQAARSVLERTLVGVNQRGASRHNLEQALQLLSAQRSAEEYVSSLAAVGTRGEDARAGVLRIRERWRSGSWRGEWVAPGRSGAVRVEAPRVLALEMALHEESERQALEGELTALEARWREAEEIAQIADAL